MKRKKRIKKTWGSMKIDDRRAVLGGYFNSKFVNAVDIELLPALKDLSIGEVRLELTNLRRTFLGKSVVDLTATGKDLFGNSFGLFGCY